MSFTDDRALHSRGVAVLMKRLTPTLNHEAKRHGMKIDVKPDEMALLGWLHDFGHLLDDDPDKHAEVMGRLMDDEDAPWSMVVARHGDSEKVYTPVDFLLNLCDMSIDGKGRLVSMDMRVKDVEERWGVDHWRVAEVRKMKDVIESNELWPALDAEIRDMPEYPGHEWLEA